MTHLKALFIVFILALPAAVCGDDLFVGHWANVDKGTRARGLSKIVVTSKDQGGLIQVWADNDRNDLGKTKLHLLGDSVGAMKMNYGFASWDSGFAVRYLTLRKEKDKLIVENFRIYKDKSGRSNFRTRFEFKKTM
jgi:hypothetical protein